MITGLALLKHTLQHKKTLQLITSAHQISSACNSLSATDICRLMSKDELTPDRLHSKISTIFAHHVVRECGGITPSKALSFPTLPLSSLMTAVHQPRVTNQMSASKFAHLSFMRPTQAKDGQTLLRLRVPTLPCEMKASWSSQVRQETLP